MTWLLPCRRTACRSFRARLLFSISFLFCLFVLSAQDNPFSGLQNQPIRLNAAPFRDLLGGEQSPPFERLAAYLSNAFVDPEDPGQLYIQDSSVCATGLENLTDFEEDLKALYRYTETGQIAEMTFLRKADDGDWTPYSRKRYTYQDQRLDEYLYQLWDAGAGDWADRYQERLRYDAAGRRASLVSRGRQAGQSWTFQNRDTLIYDADGNLIRYSGAVWENDQWTPRFRREASYNNEKQPLITAYQEWTGSAWDTLLRETNRYDSLGFYWTDYLLEKKADAGGGFQPVAREKYTYNNLEGFWSEGIRQTWEASSGAWVNETRDEFGYKARGIWTDWLRQTWSGQEWQPVLRRRFSLQPNTGIQEDITQRWESAAGDWLNESRNLVRFDRFGHLVREAGPQVWDEAGGEWKNKANTLQCRHFWSPLTSTARQEITRSMECFFPNPYNAGRLIDCPSLDANGRFQLQVTDMTGRVVYRQNVQGGQALSIDRSLPFGLYLLTIFDAQAIHYSTKLIITP